MLQKEIFLTFPLFYAYSRPKRCATRIADAGILIQSSTAFFHKIPTGFVAGCAGSTLDSVYKILVADIYFSTIIPVNAEVLDIVKGIYMVSLKLFLTAIKGVFMSKYISGNQKHLILKDRVFIENFLNQNNTYKDIVKYLCNDQTPL